MVCCTALALLAVQAPAAEKPSGNWACYDLTSSTEHKAPPLSQITVSLGPSEQVAAKKRCWWQMDCVKDSGERFAIRVLSDKVPLASADAPGTVYRYILREGDAQPIEYIDARSGRALLPKFDFAHNLVPRTEPLLKSGTGFPATGLYLGHIITLFQKGTDGQWQEWPAPLPLKLNLDEIEFCYGLAKDTEGHYVSEGDYTYVPLTQEEIGEMVDLGLNAFWVDDKLEEWAIRKPVFYYKQFSEQAAVKYPEILYRSTFRGVVPFIDEPECHILSDRRDIDRVRLPEQGARLLTSRLEEIWNRPKPGEWRRGLLREQLLAKGVNLGTITLDDDDHPIWMTMAETAFYQLQGGAAGVVQEGRYRVSDSVGEFGDYVGACEKFFNARIDLSARDVLVLNYAWLRGAARAFDKSWGMSIYGQCDPEIAPEAMTLAYDMGARYIWLWTYDHQHHLPQFKKLELLKHLQEHKANHPRAPLDKLLCAPRTAIVLPYGYGHFPWFDRIWDSVKMPINSLNRAGVPHREVVAAALAEGIACAKAGEDFDFTVDVGQPFKGYTRVVKIGYDASVTDSRQRPKPVALPGKFGPAAAPLANPAKPLLHIPYRTGISIDGNMSKWSNAEWVILDKKEQLEGYDPAKPDQISWNGPDDLSARVTFARDGKYLYVAAEVRDDVFHPHPPPKELHTGDSVDVALDLHTDRAGGEVATFAQVLAAALPQGNTVELVGNAEGRRRLILTDAKMSATRGERGNMVYELAIPWKQLTSIPPQMLDRCAIRFRVHDNDGGGLKGGLEYGSREKLDGVAEGFVPCSLAPLPAQDRLANGATINDRDYLIPTGRKWQLAVDTEFAQATPARLEVTLERGGHAAAAGSYPLAIPSGRSRATVSIDAKTLEPGAYTCRAKLVAGDKAIAGTTFPAYKLK